MQPCCCSPFVQPKVSRARLAAGKEGKQDFGDKHASEIFMHAPYVAGVGSRDKTEHGHTELYVPCVAVKAEHRATEP